MQPRPATPSPRTGNDWPAVVVAVSILALLAAVLVTATARWSAAEVRDLIGTLAPVLGVVTGAFVTYFFTRQATAAATAVAQMATDDAARTREATQAQLQAQNEQLKSKEDRLDVQTQRAAALHGALTAVFGMVDQDTAKRMRQDRLVVGALDPDRQPRVP